MSWINEIKKNEEIAFNDNRYEVNNNKEINWYTIKITIPVYSYFAARQ